MHQVITSVQWLRMIGKERLQAFQDAFSRSFGISLCMLDLQGKPLVVWSNSSLFCHFMIHKHEQRCVHERKTAIDHVFTSKCTRIFKCYMGLTFFIVPVLFNNQLVGLFYGGGAIVGSQPTLDPLRNTYYMPTFSEKELKNYIDILVETFNLLNLDCEKMCAVLSQPAVTDHHFPRWPDDRLSKREGEIAFLICEGHTNKDIAEKLYISEKTVKTHVSNILAKLELRSRMQLVLAARET